MWRQWLFFFVCVSFWNTIRDNLLILMCFSWLSSWEVYPPGFAQGQCSMWFYILRQYHRYGNKEHDIWITWTSSTSFCHFCRLKPMLGREITAGGRRNTAFVVTNELLACSICCLHWGSAIPALHPSFCFLWVSASFKFPCVLLKRKIWLIRVICSVMLTINTSSPSTAKYSKPQG